MRDLILRLVLGGFLVGGLCAPALAEPLDPQVAAWILAAEAEGLPTEGLTQKAREGAAKGVPEAKVAAVLEARVLAMRGVRADFPTATPLAIEAAAAARLAGASPAALSAVLAPELAAPAASAQALADLLRLGVPEAQALALVQRARVDADPRGALADTLAATALLSPSSGPGPAADAVLSALAGGQPPLAAVPASRGGPPAHSNAGGNCLGVERCSDRGNGNGNGGGNGNGNGNGNGGGGRP